jgi:hypothetical protein
MENESFEIIFTMLQSELDKNKYGQDNKMIISLINSLKSIRQTLPSKDELEEIDKEITYLDQKYDAFNELSYYWTPICINIEHQIHDNEVKKLREEMRKKREKKATSS